MLNRKVSVSIERTTTSIVSPKPIRLIKRLQGIEVCYPMKTPPERGRERERGEEEEEELER